MGVIPATMIDALGYATIPTAVAYRLHPDEAAFGGVMDLIGNSVSVGLRIIWPAIEPENTRSCTDREMWPPPPHPLLGPGGLQSGRAGETSSGQRVQHSSGRASGRTAMICIPWSTPIWISLHQESPLPVELVSGIQRPASVQDRILFCRQPAYCQPGSGALDFEAG